MWHLHAHVLAGHDAFVTSDQDGMLKKRERLRREVGIVVVSPTQAAAMVSA